MQNIHIKWTTLWESLNGGIITKPVAWEYILQPVNTLQITVQNIVCGACNSASFSYLTFIYCIRKSSLTKLTHIYHLGLSYIQNKYHKIITEVTY
jgi:hypothetical protein